MVVENGPASEWFTRIRREGSPVSSFSKRRCARQKESPSYRIVFLQPLLAVKTAATFCCFEFMSNHHYAEYYASIRNIRPEAQGAGEP